MPEFEAYRGLFLAESRENQENVAMNLLLLEKDSDRGAIDETFRSIHMLKGASASMGFSHLEHLCQAMEDVFSRIRNGDASISPELGNLLHLCSDLIGQMLDEIESGGDSSSKNPDELVKAMRRWIEQSDTRQKSGKESPLSQSVPLHPVISSPLIDTENLQEYEIHITVSGESAMKRVRAMLALRKLEALGMIISVFPPKEVLCEGTFDGALRLVIASDAGEETLRTAVSGPGIQNIEIRTVNKQEILAPDEMQDVTSFLHRACETGKRSDKFYAPGIPEGEGRAGEKRETLVTDEVAGTVRSEGDDEQQSLSDDKEREMNHLRVDIHQLDHIMNLTEDLIINRQRLRQIARSYTIKEMDEAIDVIDRSVSELHSLVMNIRLIPLNHFMDLFRTVAQNVAQSDGKEVEFVLDGGETELEWSVMNRLIDPLLYLIRYAVYHGIESPKARKLAGKRQKGHIRLSARRERDNVIIELTDDGTGISIDRVGAKAIEKGLITSKAADTFTTDQAVEILFQPGFSASEKIPEKIGRETGLYAVRKYIDELNGTIRMETTPGKGNRFVLLLPPSMAVLDVMVIRINKKRFGIPISSIVEVTDFRRDAIHHIGKGEVILFRDEVLQVLRLDEIAGVSQESGVIVVVLYQKRKCCIPVDVVEGRQEVVVKPLSSFIGVTRGVKGVTILGDGDIIPVLDINTLV
jgi:two-component system chemotaxis sensor kinase CheA